MPETRLAQLEAFFEAMFQRAVIQSGDIDCWDAVESMEKHGLVTTEAYDREAHGDLDGAEPGDPITVRVKQ